MDCPLDCEHLREARLHEKPGLPTDIDLPNKDIRLTEDYLREHDALVAWLALALKRSMEKERAVDWDAREALDALVRTYRTLESGLIYETRPQNPYAAALQESLKKSVDELRGKVQEETGMNTLRDADVLAAMVFLQRVELQYNNGRRRGRSFLSFLANFFREPAGSAVAL